MQHGDSMHQYVKTRYCGSLRFSPSPDKQDKCVNEVIFCMYTQNITSNLLIKQQGDVI